MFAKISAREQKRWFPYDGHCRTPRGVTCIEWGPEGIWGGAKEKYEVVKYFNLILSSSHIFTGKLCNSSGLVEASSKLLRSSGLEWSFQGWIYLGGSSCNDETKHLVFPLVWFFSVYSEVNWQWWEYLGGSSCNDETKHLGLPSQILMLVVGLGFSLSLPLAL
jgi:hypothetical protein